jgi:hypothetical protein
MELAGYTEIGVDIRGCPIQKCPLQMSPILGHGPGILDGSFTTSRDGYEVIASFLRSATSSPLFSAACTSAFSLCDHAHNGGVDQRAFAACL